MSDTTVARRALDQVDLQSGPRHSPSMAVSRTVTARIPTADGSFNLHHFRSEWDDKNHLALVLGDARGEDLLVRVHSECFTGDVLGSRRCDCGEQLTRALQRIAAEGRGALIYLRQEGRGIGLEDKLRAYNLQDEGYDTVDANLLLGHQADERDYTAAALILQELGARSVRLLTNNPAKIEGLAALGIEVAERIPLQTPPNPENRAYLETKVARMRHIIKRRGQSCEPDVQVTDEKGAYLPLLRELQTRIARPSTDAGRPFVTLSYAQSLDGCLTTRQGRPYAISAPASLAMTHSLRALHAAILVGIETALADDPALTVRLVSGESPRPVVVDSQLRTPPDARLLRGARGAWIATTEAGARSSRRLPLERAGARVAVLPAHASGRVDLAALLGWLGAEGIRSLMVEGGSRILTGFLERGLANYAVITVAPVFLGGYGLMQPTRGQEEDSFPAPRLQNVQQLQLMGDTVLWGEFEEKMARNGRPLP